MTRLIPLIVAMLSASAFAAPRPKTTVHCTSGNLVPEFEVHFDFQTEGPLITETTIWKNKSGKPPSKTREILVAPDRICGVKIDFAKHCKTRDAFVADEYFFQFKCAGGYEGDLSFLLDKDGHTSFRCNGPGVDITMKNRLHRPCTMKRS